MKSSEILREAKKHLWNGRGHYKPEQYYTVCSAVVAAARTAYLSGPIRARIMVSIYPHNTVTEWVAAQLGVDRATLTDREKQQYRHAWVDHLIATYESEGD